jgi:hypothetical protein
MVHLRLLSVLAVAGCAVASQAFAATYTYDFSYSDVGDDISASGTITINTSIVLPSNVANFSVASQSITNGGGQGSYASGVTATGYAITQISGTRIQNSVSTAITGLYPQNGGGIINYTPAGNYIFDNILYVGYAGSVPFVDLGGLEYSTGSGNSAQYYNVYTNPASTQQPFPYFENLTPLGGLAITATSNGEPGAGISPVPLPAALPLFGTAIAGLGGFNWLRRRRKVRSDV